MNTSVLGFYFFETANDMTLLMFAVIAYLLGSVSFAMISSWLFKLPDPRTYGSKNPGATNVLRSGKRSAAIVTLLGDAGKGWLAVALSQFYAPLGDWIIRLSRRFKSFTR